MRAPVALRFQSGTRRRSRRGHHLEGLRIVERQRRQIERRCRSAASNFYGPVQHRQRRQAQEIELHQAGLLHRLHAEYCVTSTSERGSLVERHQLDQRPVADHHAGGVGASVAVQPLQLQRDLASAAPTCSSLVAQSRSCRSPSIAFGQRHGLRRVVRDHLRRRGRPGRRAAAARGRHRAATARACSLPKVMICATRSWPCSSRT